MRDGQKVRDVRPLDTRQDAERVPSPVAGELQAISALDVFASAVFMWAAFAGRSISRCSTDRVAGFDSIGAK